MSLWETNEMFQSMFDVRLEGAIVYFPSGREFGSGKHSVAAGSSGLLVDLDAAPTHLLLGRNGSGKSLLLKSLERVAHDEINFPSTSLLFRVPDDESFARWERAKQNLTETDRFRELVELHERQFMQDEHITLAESAGLPLARRFCSSLTTFVPDDRVAWDFPLSRDGVLRHFGLEHLVDGFIGLQRSRNEDIPEDLWMSAEVNNPRCFAAEFVVGAYASEMSRWFENSFGGRVPIAEWFDDPLLADLVGRAVEQFFGSITHIEYFGGGGTWSGGGSMRLISEFPEFGPLADFLRRVEEDWKRADETEDGPTEFGRSNRYFPHALFDVVTIGGRQMVASRLIARASSVVGRPGEGIVSVVDVSPDQSAGEKAMSAIWALFSDQDVITVANPPSDVEGDDAAALRGVSLSLTVDESVRRFLEKVGLSLSRCGIGVDGIRLSFSRPENPGIGRVRTIIDDRSVLRTDDDHLRAIRAGRSLMETMAESEGWLLSPRLEWRDGSTGEWRPVEHASLGQLQVMLLLLRMHHILREDVRRDGHAFVLGDEFDRNLHPEATKLVLSELQRIVVDAERLTVVLSTHSVQPLGMAPLAGIQRIYAERVDGVIRYSGSADALRSTVEDVLGTSTLDAWKLMRVHVLLEGLHDLMVVEDLISNQIPEIGDVNLINGNGVNGWSGVFGNLLRFMEAPVLLVYDKRNAELQRSWEEVKQVIRERNQIPNWAKTPLGKLLEEVKSRRKGGMLPGDHELRQVLTVLQKQVLGSRDPGLALRVHLFGLERDDIVDYLQVASFPEAAKYGSDWPEIHRAVRKKFGSHVSGERFKEIARISEKSVRRAIADNADRVEPELAELVNVIRRLAAEQEGLSG